eukprot:707249-Prymnesium_polylepis.1
MELELCNGTTGLTTNVRDTQHERRPYRGRGSGNCHRRCNGHHDRVRMQTLPHMDPAFLPPSPPLASVAARDSEQKLKLCCEAHCGPRCSRKDRRPDLLVILDCGSLLQKSKLCQYQSSRAVVEFTVLATFKLEVKRSLINRMLAESAACADNVEGGGDRCRLAVRRDILKAGTNWSDVARNGDNGKVVCCFLTVGVIVAGCRKIGNVPVVRLQTASAKAWRAVQNSSGIEFPTTRHATSSLRRSCSERPPASL